MPTYSWEWAEWTLPCIPYRFSRDGPVRELVITLSKAISLCAPCERSAAMRFAELELHQLQHGQAAHQLHYSVQPVEFDLSSCVSPDAPTDCCPTMLTMSSPRIKTRTTRTSSMKPSPPPRRMAGMEHSA